MFFLTYYFICIALMGRVYEGVYLEAFKKLFPKNFKCFLYDEYENITAERGVPSPVYACKFGHGSHGHLLALANEDGNITIHNSNLKYNKCVLGEHAHSNAIFDLAWISEYAQLASVSGDQNLMIWDVQDGKLKNIQKMSGHTRSVKTVAANPFDPCILATGGRDGNIIIWDKRCHTNYKADEIISAHSKSRIYMSSASKKMSPTLGNNCTSCVQFQNDCTLLSAGTSDGLIKFWDLRKTYCTLKREPIPQYILEHSGYSSHCGITSLSISPDRHHLYASCMDNIIYCYHLANPTSVPINIYTGHTCQTYYVKICLSPCGSYILSGSSDNCAYIWQTASHSGKPLVRLTGHMGEVTAVDWCSSDINKIVACCDDMDYRIYRAHSTSQNDPEIKVQLRGLAETYIEDSSKITSFVDFSHILRTPSSRNLKIIAATPCTPSDYSSPKPQSTKSTPCTPKTGDRNSLLHWLSTSKTTPKNSQKIAIGRKTKRNLSDFLEDQENVLNGEQASKDKRVLNSATKQPSAAKMLRYDESKHNLSNGKYKYLETVKLDCSSEIKSLSEKATNAETLFRKFKTPTSDLPNYVLDGIYSHKCLEASSTVKQLDWLTSFSNQRKPKFLNTRASKKINSIKVKMKNDK